MLNITCQNKIKNYNVGKYLHLPKQAWAQMPAQLLTSYVTLANYESL